jgi:hypothetical protein
MSMHPQNTLVHQNLVVKVAFGLENTMIEQTATTSWLLTICFF